MDQQHLEARALQGDPAAQFAMGDASRSGADGRPPNIPAALQWYFKAASQDHVPAQVALAKLLLDDLSSIGVKRNPGQAVRWLQKAAAAGDASAGHRLGLALLGGDGVERDPELGMSWLVRAAEAGNADARYEAACRYALGKEAPLDTERYHHMLIAGAKEGHVRSLNHLAMLMQHGAGFDRNEALAARIYEYVLARFGDAAAAHSLGIATTKGLGVPVDHEMALELMEYAVGAGLDDALYSVGLLRLSAPGVKDLVESVKWAALSAARLPEGSGPKLLEVLGKLCTPEQLEEGRRRAAEWRRVPKGLTLMRVGELVNPVDAVEFTWTPNG